MANIQPEITAFKSAVYGEEVRDAMVSLANKLNDESSAASTAANNAMTFATFGSTDLNDISSTCFGYSNGGENSNSPLGLSGLCMNFVEGSIKHQIFWSHTQSKMFVRSYGTNGWSVWHPIHASSDIFEGDSSFPNASLYARFNNDGDNTGIDDALCNSFKFVDARNAPLSEQAPYAERGYLLTFASGSRSNPSKLQMWFTYYYGQLPYRPGNILIRWYGQSENRWSIWHSVSDSPVHPTDSTINANDGIHQYLAKNYGDRERTRIYKYLVGTNDECPDPFPGVNKVKRGWLKTIYRHSADPWAQNPGNQYGRIFSEFHDYRSGAILSRFSKGTEDVESVETIDYLPWIVTPSYIYDETDGLLKTSNNDGLPVDNYFIGRDLIRRPVSITLLGTLTRVQSFCKVGDYFYSTNGSKLAKQDLDFNLITETDCVVGHGNSLQIGDDGYAYSSGWDDGKIYKVDLETMSVVDTITLPVGGYTTCAIDTTQNLLYIFYRSSYPTTEVNYEFIVWDYVNDIEVKRRTTNIQFGAMQSVDLYNSTIIVLAGLGRTDERCPNKVMLFDLDGNLIGRYYFETWTREPEGVCIDRDTGVFYYSVNNGNVARVSFYDIF